MEQLDKFIFQENKIVTPEFLCEHAQVSLVEAKSFMEIFYEVHKGTNGLWATFMAFGTIARSGVRIETTVVFRDADMERVKEEFEEIIKMELLSLQVVEIHDLTTLPIFQKPQPQASLPESDGENSQNRSPNHPREEGEEIDEQNSTENRSTNDGDSISSGDILPPNDSPEWSSSTTPEDDASDNERPKSSYSWGIVSPDNSEVDSRSPPPSGTPEHVSPIQNFLDSPDYESVYLSLFNESPEQKLKYSTNTGDENAEESADSLLDYSIERANESAEESADGLLEYSTNTMDKSTEESAEGKLECSTNAVDGRAEESPEDKDDSDSDSEPVIQPKKAKYD